MKPLPAYVTELTPPGRGAVAVVLVEGTGAVASVDALITAANRKPLEEQPLGRIVFGKWGGEEGESLIVCRRSETQVEVHPHGGVAAVQNVVEGLRDFGCATRTWQDVYNYAPKKDAFRSAAVIALSEATTQRTAAILLDQYHGAFEKAMVSISANLKQGHAAKAKTQVETLLAHAELGQHLTQPWRVVFAGPPNVGKSSLINAVLGYERSIVTAEPGTTRDVVTASTAIDGWPVELSDTAGIREGAGEIEAQGIAYAAQQLAEADLVFWVTEAGGDAAAPSRLFGQLKEQKKDQRELHVVNKIDLQKPGECDAVTEREGTLRTSTHTGEGIEGLLAAISSSLVPSAPAPGEAVPITEEQVCAIERLISP